MRISEIYESKQGEGLLTGIPSVFLRTSGCNLRCDFCDTPYTSWNPQGDQLEINEIIQQIQMFDAKHVVITGGEPMLPPDIEPLSRQIKSLGFHITIETAGTLFRDVACDLISISPKMSNSTPTPERAGEWSARHESLRLQPAVVQRLMEAYDYQLKFVVADPDDIVEIKTYLGNFDEYLSNRVLLMPEGVDNTTLEKRAIWLAPQCEQLGFVYCPRKHIEWYGNRRGT